MVKQFLKIAGVKTQAEFYKKYPSEEAFFRAHPEAQHLVHQKMAYGGMYSYGPGGPILPGTLQTVIQQMQPLDTIPSVAATLPVVAPVDPLIQTQQQPSFNLNPYTGTSVWDMLTAQGKAGDFSTRKKLAKILGIANYIGNKDQNKMMMDLIRQNPDVLTSIPSESNINVATPTKKKASKSSSNISNDDYSSYIQSQEASNPYLMADSVNPTAAAMYMSLPRVGVDSKSKAASSSIGTKLAIGAGAALGAGAGIGAISEIKDLLKRASRGEYLSGQAKAKVTAYRNQFRNQMLKEAGSNVKAQQKWFKSLPKEQQEIIKNLDVMEIPGDIHLMPHGTASRDLYTRDMVNEANAENLITNASDALREVEEEKKALRAANARKAAAARWSTKAAEAEKTLGLGDRLMSGLNAIGESRYVAPVADAVKGFFEAFHEHGGQHNTPYSGTYHNGVYFDNGGSFIPDYGMMAAGQLPEYSYGKAMYGMGMAEGGQMPQWLAERRFAAAGNEHMMKDYGYATGGQKGGVDQQIVQGVAQMLQQGAKPEEILQELIQAKVPQKKAIAIIQNVMQKIGASAQPQQMIPPQQQMDQSQMAYGGTYAKGGEYDMSEEEVQDLINKGYKIEYL